MTKKQILIVLFLILAVTALAACSGLQLPGGSASGSEQPAGTAQAQGGNPRVLSVEDKLGMGTLLLEDTENSVTAEQAKTLLPLWKAVKSLSTSDTASPEEIAALYTQIQETMTAEQVKAIEETEVTQEVTNALREKYDIQGTFMSEGMPNLSEEERATRVAQFRSQGGGNGGNGVIGPGQGGGGGMGPGGGGNVPGGAPGGQQTVRRTPQAGQGGRQLRGGMNLLYADAVITLLQERSGS